MDRTGRREILSTGRQNEPDQTPAHLLKVVASVNRDAADVWAELWSEFKPHISSSGAVQPTMEKGFVPSCGWTEFMERMWLLKHYLDQMSRVCQDKH